MTKPILDPCCDLMLGDCLDLLGSIPDSSIDMVLCDLPYGMTRNAWDCEIDLDELWSHYRRVVKHNGAVVLFASGMFTSRLMASNPSMWRYNLVWRKTTPTGFLNAKRMPLRAHEDICVFYRKLPVYHPQMGTGPRKVSSASSQGPSRQSSNYGSYGSSSYDSTERYPTSVLEFASDKQRCAIHPTQKPVALCEWLIRTYTDEGGVVLDNCMGSGSTGVAAIHCGRRFVGIEKDEGYYTAALERLQREGNDHGEAIA